MMNVQQTQSYGQNFGAARVPAKVPAKILKAYLKPSLAEGYDLQIAAKSKLKAWQYFVDILKNGEKTGPSMAFVQKSGTDENQMINKMVQKVQARVVADSKAKAMFEKMA